MHLGIETIEKCRQANTTRYGIDLGHGKPIIRDQKVGANHHGHGAA